MAIISKTYGKILAAIVALLGFSSILISCAKYGAPMATYKVKGVVVSETDGVPIEGIRAVLKTQPNETGGMESVYTNNKGIFNLKSNDGYSMLYVELADVDEGKNGLFNDTTVVADFSHVKFKGDVSDGREVEKDLGIIRMKSQE